MPYQSVELQLADAVATAIAAALTGGDPPAVTATVNGRVRRESITELQVRVMPAGRESAETWRDADRDAITLQVAAIGPGDPADIDTVDAGLALANELWDLWGESGAMREAEFDGWYWRPPLIQTPLWRQDLLDDQKLFVAAIAVTYVHQH